MTSAPELAMQAAQIVATAIGTYMVCFATVDGNLRRARKELNEQGRRIDRLMADCEAAKRQRERDLERWSDGLAASFGTELEDATDRLMEAMFASKQGGGRHSHPLRDTRRPVHRGGRHALHVPGRGRVKEAPHRRAIRWGRTKTVPRQQDIKQRIQHD